MSHWGKGTGYDYTTERCGFLNQSIATQRRATFQAAMRPSGFAAMGTPRDLQPLSPLPLPMKRDDLHTSTVLQFAAHRHSNRRHGQLNPPAFASTEPYSGQRTCSQLAFCRPSSGFLRAFGAVDRRHGKVRDDTTQFREQVYGLWNISGEPSPHSGPTTSRVHPHAPQLIHNPFLN